MTAIANPGTTRYLGITRPDGSVGRIAYDGQGAGPVVLLAPGMGTTRATFRHLAPLLLRAGYRIMTTDYRGLGESDTGWAGYGSAATAEAKLPRAKASAIPALVLMGTADEDFPDAAAEARFVADSLGAELELLDGYGHRPHEEAPGLIAELILGFGPAAPVADAAR